MNVDAFALVGRTAVLAIVAAALPHERAGNAAVTYGAVAVEGQAAPGVPGAVFTNIFGATIGSPVIDASGRVAFRTFLVGAGVTSANDSATFVGQPGGLSMWIREGQTLPGGVGTFTNNSDNQSGFPVIGSGGMMAMQAPSTLGSAYLVGPTTGPTSFVRATGGAAPGLPAGTTLSAGIGAPVVSANGSHAFAANLGSVGPFAFRIGIFSNHTGVLAPVAITGAAVGGAGSAIFVNGLNGAIAFGAADHIAFHGSSAGVRSIYSDRGGAAAIVIGPGVGVPGTGASVSNVITDVSIPFAQDVAAPSVNRFDQFAFRATLSNGTSGVFSEGLGGLHRVALTNGAIPGMPGAQFGDVIGMLPLINDRGEVAFVDPDAFYSGFVRDTLFVERQSGLEIIARQGDASPITDAAFGAIDPFTARLNNKGLVVFSAFLTGAGVNAANDRGLFGIDAVGGPVIAIFREGDLFDVFGDGSVMKTIAAFEFSGFSAAFNPSSGLGSGHGAFNDDGVLAFHLSFTDGSRGIFTATIPAAPTALVGGLWLGVGARGRRRGSMPAGARA